MQYTFAMKNPIGIAWETSYKANSKHSAPSACTYSRVSSCKLLLWSQRPLLVSYHIYLSVMLPLETKAHYVKVSRSVAGMAYRPTSKVVIPSKTEVSPKDKDPVVNKSGPIYWFQCGNLCSDDEYIGESHRTFGERYKEHLKDLSPIHQHSNHTCHPTSHNIFQIIGREGHSLARNIKESIFIMVNNPTLNRNIVNLTYPTNGIESYSTHLVSN